MRSETQAKQKKTPTPPTLPESLTKDVLLRLPQVLAVVPIPKSSWWRGIKEGRFPKGIKLSARTTVWRASEIEALVNGLGDRTKPAA